LGRWMFRFDHDNAAFFAIFNDLLLYATLSLGPNAIRIIQQLESIWATFLYYQETGIPLVTSFHESLRLKANRPANVSTANFLERQGDICRIRVRYQVSLF